MTLCACTQHVRQNQKSEYKDTVRDAAVQVADKSATTEATKSTISESDGAAQKKYCSSIRKFKVMEIGDDYIIAAEEGSTMVRIGSLIFGERNYGPTA